MLLPDSLGCVLVKLYTVVYKFVYAAEDSPWSSLIMISSTPWYKYGHVSSISAVSGGIVVRYAADDEDKFEAMTGGEKVNTDPGSTLAPRAR